MQAQAHLRSLYPYHCAQRPGGLLIDEPYRVRFGRDADDLDAVHELRGGRSDDDRFDLCAHHLLVETVARNELVASCRIMSAFMARRSGFAASAEFTLDGMPPGVLAQCVEVGHTCVRAGHRDGRALELLWRGVTRYVRWNEARYLLVSSTFPTADHARVAALLEQLEGRGVMHDTLRLKTFAPNPLDRVPPAAEHEAPTLPNELEALLRLGAKVVSLPSFDDRRGESHLLSLFDYDRAPQRITDYLGGNDRWSIDLLRQVVHHRDGRPFVHGRWN